MDIPSNWKASSSNDEKHATYENGNYELRFRDSYDSMKYNDTLEEAGADFKQFTQDDATYEDVSDLVPGKLGGKLDMFTIDCTYHAILISFSGSGETNYPCKLIRVYLGGHDVEICFISKKGDFKDFDEAIASARCDEVPVREEKEFDKDAAVAEILALFQPYLDTLNHMEDEIIASIEANEETITRLSEYYIDKEKFASAFAGTIQAEIAASSATEMFGEVSFLLTYPDFELISDGYEAYVRKCAENNQLVYSTDEELNRLVGEMLVAFLSNPDFPVTTELFDGNYFKEEDGWKLQNGDEIEEIIESLCYLTNNY